ncbi:MAG: hypothetical protein JXC85_03320 [Candidatus Aenigmarchaeota archaeon]|nr:hypothetical protein [Candidatus Aenigmarchaeota archaeon]
MPRKAQKAQAEFALILGLLIIAIVVGMYSFSTLSPPSVLPSALTEEQKAVASYVGDMIRSAATSTISELYRNGGYLSSSTPPMGTVSHQALGSNIALWQTCGNYAIPDMEQEFSNGIRGYFQRNMPDSQAISGYTAVFGKQAMTVDTAFYDNKITLTVNMPTTVQGQSLPQPYVVDVATKMGRIYDFSQNFARMQADCRVLDNHLLVSLMQSNENSRPCWLPIVGNAQRSYTFTWSNLRDCMESHIKYSLSNTVMGKELPVDDDGKIMKWGIEMFPVPAVIDYSAVPAEVGVCSGGAEANSKKYDDLFVTYYFGDDDGLDRSEFAAPEHLSLQPEVGPFMRFMQGIRVNQYTQPYSVKYPVIVNVWDESVRKSFKFATYVFIDNLDLGQCNAIPGIASAVQSEYSATYDDTCVSGATEDANILVTYDDGSDVVGATVTFHMCELGTTGRGLPIQTKVPPVWGALRVRDGQNEYTECRMYTALRNLVVTIPKSKRFVFNFYTVGVSKSGSTYTIDSVSPATERIDVGMSMKGDLCDPPEPEIIVNMDDSSRIVSELTVANLPVVEYGVSVETYDGQVVGGFVNMTGFKPTGSELYVYSPKLDGFSEADLDGVQGLFESCGIDPISTAEYPSKVGCSWTG